MFSSELTQHKMTVNECNYCSVLLHLKFVNKNHRLGYAAESDPLTRMNQNVSQFLLQS